MSSVAVLPGVGRTSLSTSRRCGFHAAVKARVLSSQTVFAKPSRHCYSSKRGAIIRPQAQYSSGGGPPEGNKKLSTGDIVTIGGEVLTRTLTQGLQNPGHSGYWYIEYSHHVLSGISSFTLRICTYDAIEYVMQNETILSKENMSTAE
eukprot:1133565-Pyramimonas_sp.AAC.2